MTRAADECSACYRGLIAHVTNTLLRMLPVVFHALQDDVAGCLEYYAGLAEKLDARQDSPIDVGMEEFAVRVRREPLGVVALITPWNYPLLMATVRSSGACLGCNAECNAGCNLTGKRSCMNGLPV